jgi:hypothetical protein
MSSRMEQLQALLGENPNDVFLSYALALEHLSIGETEKGISILLLRFFRKMPGDSQTPTW